MNKPLADVNFTFQIISPKYGTFTVIAPCRFRDEISRYKWGIRREADRAVGREFLVVTSIPHPRGGLAYNRHDGWRGRRMALSLHRLVWKLAGREITPELDHKDGQPLNNSEDNLRAATTCQNGANRQLPRNNKSGAAGVHWSAKEKRWIAQIRHEGKRICLGFFGGPDGFENAVAARDAAALRLRGEFAVLNRPQAGTIYRAPLR